MTNATEKPKPLSAGRTDRGSHWCIDPALAAARFLIRERGLSGAARVLHMGEKTLMRVASGSAVRYGTLCALHDALVRVLGRGYVRLQIV